MRPAPLPQTWSTDSYDKYLSITLAFEPLMCYYTHEICHRLSLKRRKVANQDDANPSPPIAGRFQPALQRPAGDQPQYHTPALLAHLSRVASRCSPTAPASCLPLLARRNRGPGT